MAEVAITPGQIGELNKKLVLAGIKDSTIFQGLLDNPDRFRTFLNILVEDTGGKEWRDWDRREQLSQLFDSQLTRLSMIGFAESLIESFHVQKNDVIKKCVSEKIFIEEYSEGDERKVIGHPLHHLYIPFLPVIPHRVVPIQVQMNMVKTTDKNYSGVCFIDPSSVTYEIEERHSPYYAFGFKLVRNKYNQGNHEVDTIEEALSLVFQYGIHEYENITARLCVKKNSGAVVLRTLYAEGCSCCYARACLI